MKKIFLCAVFIAASFTSIAQMGIGTTTSKGALDIESSTYGLVMPRVASTSVVENPNGGEVVNGTMVYDELNKCVAVYADGIWGCIQFIPGVPAASTTTNSNSGTITGWSNSDVEGGINHTWPANTDPCPTGYRVSMVPEWEAVEENNPPTTIGETFTESDTEIKPKHHLSGLSVRCIKE